MGYPKGLPGKKRDDGSKDPTVISRRFGGNKKATDEDIVSAYKKFLGRDPDPKGMESYRNAKMSVYELQTSLRNSAEYGERRKQERDKVKVDLTKVDEQHKPYIAAWQKRNPGQQLGEGTFKELKHWHDLTNKNIAGYEAYLDGKIKVRRLSARDGHNEYFVSQDAIDQMGGKVDLRVNTTGQVFITPKGAEWTTNQKRRRNVENAQADEYGFQIYGGAEADSKGFSGVFSELGDLWSDWLPGELTSTVDAFTGGTIGGLLGGSEARRESNQRFADMTGMKEEEVAVASQIADTVATTVLSVYFPPAGMAYAALSASSDVAAGQSNVGEAALSFYASQFIKTPTDASLGTRVSTGVARSATNTAAQMVGGKDVSPEQALLNIGTGAAASAASSTDYLPITQAALGATGQIVRGADSGAIITAASMGYVGGLIETKTDSPLAPALNQAVFSSGSFAAQVADPNIPKPPRPPRSSRSSSGGTTYYNPYAAAPSTVSDAGGAGVNRGVGAAFI
jgi:hypothetical protein